MFKHFTEKKLSTYYSVAEVEEILSQDAKALRIKSKPFVVANRYQAFYALNAHAALCLDLLEEAGVDGINRRHPFLVELKHDLKELGIISVQRSFNDLLDEFQQSIEIGDLTWLKIYASRGAYRYLHYLCVGGVDSAAVRRVCQFTGFLARFTLITDVMEGASIKKFLAVNTKCHDLHYSYGVPLRPLDSSHHGVNYGRPYIDEYNYSRRYPSEYLLRLVADELRCILGSKPIKVVEHGGFSSGATAEGNVDIPSKCRYLSTIVDSWDGIFHHVTGNVRKGPEYPYITAYPRLRAVPKSLDSRRIIAPEPGGIAFRAQAALKALIKRLQATGALDYIDRRDESGNFTGAVGNRERAQIGSSNRQIATTDLSSASDTIAKHIFFAVCPLSLRPFFASYVSWYINYTEDGKDKRIGLYTMLTSGNPLTWILEGAYFLALARTAAYLAGVKDYRSKCFSYGDDIETPTEAYETLCDLLTIFGHKVNRLKSYAHGLFRESCGGWYYGGDDVTPVFWPRSEIDECLGSLSSMISLQHKAQERGFQRMETFLTNAILCEVPDMTFSPSGEACEDLWSPTKDPYLSEKESHYQFRCTQRLKSNTQFEHWLYFHYLEYGPMYNSALDKLLNVSSSRRTAYLTGKEISLVRATPLYGEYAEHWPDVKYIRLMDGKKFFLHDSK